MSFDVLHEATRALRIATPTRPQVGDLTRARVMQSLHRQKRRSVARALVWFPLAAIFIGASAAAATGRLPRVWKVVTTVVGLESVPQSAPEDANSQSSGRSPLRRMPLPIRRPAPIPALEPAPLGAAPEVPTTPPDGGASAAVAAQVAPIRSAKRTLTVEQARAYALYREAHAAHFGERSPSRALAAWNRYLAKYPDDRLAPEARYNRALCLVRLGRYAEASPALERFASGQYGSYRKGDAQRLLEAVSPLDDEPSPTVGEE